MNPLSTVTRRPPHVGAFPGLVGEPAVAGLLFSLEDLKSDDFGDGVWFIAARARPIDEQFEAELRADKRVNDQYFFPTRVRISGRQIEFQGPSEFQGGVPEPSRAYTVLVTLADIEQTRRPGSLGPPRPTMMTSGLARGVRWSQWGIRSDSDEANPPVIDILAEL